jgi:hypothetical protein
MCIITVYVVPELRKQIAADFDGLKDSSARWARLKKFIKMSVSTVST